MTHRCNSCSKDFYTCDSGKATFGIDLNPNATGDDADLVVECDAYEMATLHEVDE